MEFRATTNPPTSHTSIWWYHFTTRRSFPLSVVFLCPMSTRNAIVEESNYNYKEALWCCQGCFFKTLQTCLIVLWAFDWRGHIKMTSFGGATCAHLSITVDDDHGILLGMAIWTCCRIRMAIHTSHDIISWPCWSHHPFWQQHAPLFN